MIELLLGRDREVSEWVSERIPESGAFSDQTRAIGVLVNGQLACGVTYSEYDGAGVRCSIAAEPKSGWASRRVLRALFSYPFVQLNCRRITVLVAAKNERSGKFCLDLGFVVEGILRHGLPDDDYVVMGMLKKECDWI